MNREALINLERVVREAPNELFNMTQISQSTFCGTAKCAFGWAQVDPWFLQNTNIASLNWLDDIDDLLPIFDIDEDDFDFLFGGDLPRVPVTNVTKEETIWNINQLLEGRHALPYRATGLPGPYALEVERIF